jgi:hypothetical protein
VDFEVDTSVLEKHAVSIFRAEMGIQGQKKDYTRMTGQPEWRNE